MNIGQKYNICKIDMQLYSLVQFKIYLTLIKFQKRTYKRLESKDFFQIPLPGTGKSGRRVMRDWRKGERGWKV